MSKRRCRSHFLLQTRPADDLHRNVGALGHALSHVAVRGEKDRLYATRKDAEYGEPPTITANIGRQAIEKNAEQYWILLVSNFDQDNAADMTLSIRYNAAGTNEPAIQPLPSDASHEFLSAHVQSLADGHERGEAGTRERLARYLKYDSGSATKRDLQYVGAPEFGFEEWDHLRSHVSQPPDWWLRPNIRVSYIDEYYEESKNAAGEIRAAEVIESVPKLFGNISDDLEGSLLAAETGAGRAGHAEVTVEQPTTASPGQPGFAKRSGPGRLRSSATA